jgi:hypothetical protein
MACEACGAVDVGMTPHDCIAELRMQRDCFEGALQWLEQAFRGPSFLRAVAGALRTVQHEHGPITREWNHSAAKRVVGALSTLVNNAVEASADHSAAHAVSEGARSRQQLQRRLYGAERHRDALLRENERLAAALAQAQGDAEAAREFASYWQAQTQKAREWSRAADAALEDVHRLLVEMRDERDAALATPAPPTGCTGQTYRNEAVRPPQAQERGTDG